MTDNDGFEKIVRTVATMATTRGSSIAYGCSSMEEANQRTARAAALGIGNARVVGYTLFFENGNSLCFTWPGNVSMKRGASG